MPSLLWVFLSLTHNNLPYEQSDCSEPLEFYHDNAKPSTSNFDIGSPSLVYQIEEQDQTNMQASILLVNPTQRLMK